MIIETTAIVQQNQCIGSADTLTNQLLIWGEKWHIAIDDAGMHVFLLNATNAGASRVMVGPLPYPVVVIIVVIMKIVISLQLGYFEIFLFI